MSAGAPIGLAMGYDPGLSVRDMAGHAAAAERAGFGMAFFSETLFTNRDSATAMAAFSLATSSMSVGTTQVVRLRSPLVMAQTAATLDELSGGRLVLVVGAYTAKHAARNGVELTPPVPTLREYVHCIRALLAGARLTYQGEVVRLEESSLNFTPVRERIPIWIAAASRKGLVNAAEIGDGVLLDAGVSPQYTANAVAVLHDACRAIGRDPSELTVAQLLNVSVDDDRQQAIDAMRWEVASKFRFASTPATKMAVGEPNIDPDDLPRFAEAYQQGGMTALAEALPERYITALTSCGTAGDVVDRVAGYRAAGVGLPLVRPAAPEQLDDLLRAFGR